MGGQDRWRSTLTYLLNKCLFFSKEKCLALHLTRKELTLIAFPLVLEQVDYTKRYIRFIRSRVPQSRKSRVTRIISRIHVTRHDTGTIFGAEEKSQEIEVVSTVVGSVRERSQTKGKEMNHENQSNKYAALFSHLPSMNSRCRGTRSYNVLVL